MTTIVVIIPIDCCIQSFDLLLLYHITTLASHVSIILIITHKSYIFLINHTLNQSLNQLIQVPTFASFVKLAGNFSHSVCISVPKKVLNPKISLGAVNANTPETVLECPISMTLKSRESESLYRVDCCKRSMHPIRARLRYMCFECEITSLCVVCMKLCHKGHTITERAVGVPKTDKKKKRKKKTKVINDSKALLASKKQRYILKLAQKKWNKEKKKKKNVDRGTPTVTDFDIKCGAGAIKFKEYVMR